MTVPAFGLGTFRLKDQTVIDSVRRPRGRATRRIVCVPSRRVSRIASGTSTVVGATTTRCTSRSAKLGWIGAPSPLSSTTRGSSLTPESVIASRSLP